jgi:hypothetical protein
MRRSALCLAFAVLAVTPVAAPAADRTRAACLPKGTTTLLQNRVARVYRDGPADDSPRFAVVGCVFAKGRQIGLDSPIEGFYAHMPPALALNGTVLGWAATDCSQECATEVHASDLARSPDEALNYSTATLREDEQVRIGSLTVTRAGGLAWITCPRRTRSEVEPRCLKPGAKVGVYRKAAGFDTPTERVAFGRDIDPSSLRRRKSTISWIQGGERRTASLTQPG